MFVNRTSKPTKSDKFIKFYNTSANGGVSKCIKGSPTDSTCNVLANCVGYACSRFNEIYAELTNTTAMKYPYLNCNAENWVERAKDTYGLKTGSTPKPGAIMVWQKGTLASSDGAGHVAIVEKVIDSKTVYTSESGYKSNAFWNSTRSNSNGNWGIGSAYKFRCFIYNPAVTDEMIEEDSKSCPYVEPSVVMKKSTHQKKFFTGTQWLQWHLKNFGLYSDAVDGYFGPLTETAVKDYQKTHKDANGNKLEVDGSVGPLTRAAIKATAAGTNNAISASNETCPYAEPTVVMNQAKYQGKFFVGVQWLQWYLTKLGLYSDDIDGYFGPKTLAGVKAFQKKANIEVDGSVGPITRASLKAAL